FIGYLPWHSSKNNFDHGLTREWKQFARGAYRSEMFAILPQEFAPIFNCIVNTRFEERPRYQFIQRMLYSSASRQNIKLSDAYDWQVVPALQNLIKKSIEHQPGDVLTNTAEDIRPKFDALAENDTVEATV
ncbi:hypothetical protein OESDEN_01613, partial [Oesophagostomum dentatum]